MALRKTNWRVLICVYMIILVTKPPHNSAMDSQKSDALVKISDKVVSVADFLPEGYIRDGSVSYQCQVQAAIDFAAKRKSTLIFPAMVYRLDELGLQVYSHLTLWMYGAVFQFGENCSKDGQAFTGHDIADIRFIGGEIVGRNESWATGVNIRGIHLSGSSKNIQIRDMRIHGLSSNGIGVFGSPNEPVRDVWVSDVVIDDCCNFYGDYLSEKAGPEKDSDRKDQGSIAFYYVHDFVVSGCRFENSRSDGTHFYKCHRGQFVHNKVYNSQMGGYFLETCADVTASDNVIKNNGSRGVTIERGSHNCTLNGNLVANSGREGLWAPDCVGLIITGNIFDKNGRKPNGDKSHQIWNANITVNEASSDPSNSPTQDYIISNNIITSTASQIAAIRIDASKAQRIVVKNNLMRGENQSILVEGDGSGRVIMQENVSTQKQ